MIYGILVIFYITNKSSLHYTENANL